MIKIFSDGACLDDFKKLSQNPKISGFTTNPSLMQKAGIKDYSQFAKNVLCIIQKKPISFEVFADDFSEMLRQALVIKNWGENVYVKIPIVNSKGASMLDLIRILHLDGVKLNITAIMAQDQLEDLANILGNKVPTVISVFAGRIADTGRDPAPTIKKAKELFSTNSLAEILWASVREVINIQQARTAGADIITVPPNLFEKYTSMDGMNLAELSRQTAEMFWKDAQTAGYTL